MPIDPIILEGAKFLWPDAFEDFLYFGGREDYLDLNRLNEVIEECDFLLKVGTPSWWNLHDRVIYTAWLQTGKPFAIWGVGTGGGYDKGVLRAWQGVTQDEWLLKQVIASDACARILVRDPTTYRIFKHHGADERLELAVCPGFFAIGDHAKIRTSKRAVAIDVLDPVTVKKDGIGRIAPYYRFIADLVNLFTEYAPEAEVRLGCQRAFGKPNFKPAHPDLDPAHWKDDVFLSVQDCLLDQVRPAELVHQMRSFETKTQWEEFYKTSDVYIGSRTHGALPSAGIGLSVCGLGIDMRGKAWEVIPSITRMPVTLPDWDANRVMRWYLDLDPVITSKSMLHHREMQLEIHNRFISDCEEHLDNEVL